MGQCLGQRHSVLASEDGHPSRRLVERRSTVSSRTFPKSYPTPVRRCNPSSQQLHILPIHAVLPAGADFHSLGLCLSFEAFSCIIDCRATTLEVSRCSTLNQLATPNRQSLSDPNDLSIRGSWTMD